MRRTSRTRYRLPRFSLAALLLALAAVVLFAALYWLREPLSGALWRVAAPLMRATAIGESEQARLRSELEALSALAADRAVLYEENLYLKRLMGRETAVDTVLAAVVMRPPGSPYDTLVIDAGDTVGILPGSFVSAGGGSIIGTVSHVYANTSRVTLLSSPGEQHEMLLRREGEEVLPVTLVGQGSGAFVAEVPAGSGAQVGDAVIFSGLGSGLVATVSAVEVEDSRSFERLHLRLPANAQYLRFVEVWRSAPIQ